MKRIVAVCCLLAVLLVGPGAHASEPLTLLVNRGTKEAPRSAEIAVFTPLPGYTHNPAIHNLVTPSEPLFQMEPESNEDPLYAYILRGSARPADALATAAHANIASLYETVGPLLEHPINGETAWYFVANGPEPFADAPGVFVNDLFLYLPGPGDSCVLIDISQRLDSPAYLPEAEMLAFAETVAATLSFLP